ncbi:MAG: 3-hydroxybutyryl-CoA dehydrogenase [Acidobacteria bacterium]|nr:3-hydroxybutyryl-CoA dehydrogenase [Acidobacteriota bacterium]
MEIRTVGVLGCGLMGSGIAQVCAASGYRTIVREVNAATLQAGLANINVAFSDGVKKGKMTADGRERAVAKLTGTIHADDLSSCDLIIEAVVEDADAKRAAYLEVEPVLPAHTIIASNTSSLSITTLAAMTKRPDRVVGLHFFNPVPVMKLVEVIRGMSTTQATFDTALSFAESLSRQPVPTPDRPGFIVNRLLLPYLLDAIREHENGLGSIEAIDTAMKLGCSHPMGPFALVDCIGLDTTYYIANVLFEELREPRFAPPPLLKRMVTSGRLGRKSGHGFYSYT